MKFLTTASVMAAAVAWAVTASMPRASAGEVRLPHDKVTPVGFYHHYGGDAGCYGCGTCGACGACGCGDCGACCGPVGGCGGCAAHGCPYVLGGLAQHLHCLKDKLHSLFCCDSGCGACGGGCYDAGCCDAGCCDAGCSDCGYGEFGHDVHYGDDVELVPTPAPPGDSSADPFEDDSQPEGSSTRRPRRVRPTAGRPPVDRYRAYRSRMGQTRYVRSVPRRPRIDRSPSDTRGYSRSRSGSTAASRARARAESARMPYYPSPARNAYRRW